MASAVQQGDRNAVGVMRGATIAALSSHSICVFLLVASLRHCRQKAQSGTSPLQASPLQVCCCEATDLLLCCWAIRTALSATDCSAAGWEFCCCSEAASAQKSPQRASPVYLQHAVRSSFLSFSDSPRECDGIAVLPSHSSPSI